MSLQITAGRIVKIQTGKQLHIGVIASCHNCVPLLTYPQYLQLWIQGQDPHQQLKNLPDRQSHRWQCGLEAHMALV